MANDNNTSLFCNPFAVADFSQFIPDFNSVIEAQRHNIGVYFDASQAIMRSSQAILLRQCDMWMESIHDSKSLISKIVSSTTTEEKINGQKEIACNVVEKAVSNSRELVEMAANFQMQAADMLSLRVNDALSEIRMVCARR